MKEGGYYTMKNCNYTELRNSRFLLEQQEI